MVDSTGPQCLWCRTSETSYHDKDDRQCKYYCLFNEFSHDSNDVCCNGWLSAGSNYIRRNLIMQISNSLISFAFHIVCSAKFPILFVLHCYTSCVLFTLNFLFCPLRHMSVLCINGWNCQGQDTHCTGHLGTCLPWSVVYLVMGLDGFLCIASSGTSSGCRHT